jgi:hypothetical protein
MKGDHLAAPGVHGKPHPLLMPLLLHAARPCIRLPLQPLPHHGAVTGNGVGVEMSRQGLGALDQQTQEPLQSNPNGATYAPPRKPRKQQAVHQRPCGMRDEVGRAACDTLPSTVGAMLRLFAVMHMTIFLICG